MTKHMEIDIFFVREKVLAKKLLVYHIPAIDQWADALTKALSLPPDFFSWDPNSMSLSLLQSLNLIEFEGGIRVL